MLFLYKFAITARFAGKKKICANVYFLYIREMGIRSLFLYFFVFRIQLGYIVEINGLHDGTSLFHEFIHSLHKLRQLDAFPRSPNMKTNENELALLAFY